MAKRTMTNADRIRSMTDEELAKFLENPNGKPWYRCDECKWESCDECCLEWLNRSVNPLPKPPEEDIPMEYFESGGK